MGRRAHRFRRRLTRSCFDKELNVLSSVIWGAAGLILAVRASRGIYLWPTVNYTTR